MNVLVKHIELLLLEYDCVILPGFGGFIANHNSACYSAEDHRMLPPTRSVAFNQNLTLNDGLLVQTYMQAYDASYPDAKRQMDKDIMRLCRELDLKGRYELSGIGVLSKDGKGNLMFEPMTSGLLTLEYYGLDAFDVLSTDEMAKQKMLKKQISEVSVLPVIIENTAGTTQSSIEADAKDTDAHTDSAQVAVKKNRIFNIKKVPSVLMDVFVSSAAAVVLFFFFAYPTLTDRRAIIETEQRSEASIVSVKPTKSISKKDSQIPDPVVAKVEPADEASHTAQQADAASEVFTIVLASYVTEPNAMVFIKNMSAQGYSDCKYVKQGKVARIVYGSYQTNEDAMEDLRKLRQKNKAFAEAWVRQQ